MSAYRDALLRDHPEQLPAYDAATAAAGRLLAVIQADIAADAAAGDPDALARYQRMRARAEAREREHAA